MPISIYTILDPTILATVATIIVAIMVMRHRQRLRAARRASHEFTGPAEPLPDPSESSRPRKPWLTPLHKRLLISLALIIAIALICWKLLPLAHIDIPWWVPILAFVAIVAAALGTAREETPSDPDGPFPFVPGDTPEDRV